MNDQAHVRASDADRELVALQLREHYAAGRLREEELSQRLEAVYAASTLGELEQVGSDLPRLPLPPQARRAELAQRQAQLRARLLQRAGGSFSPFVICTVVWAASGAEATFWPAFTLIAPILYIGRNLWRLHGPAPELDRVEAELSRERHRRGRARVGPGMRRR